MAFTPYGPQPTTKPVASRPPSKDGSFKPYVPKEEPVAPVVTEQAKAPSGSLFNRISDRFNAAGKAYRDFSVGAVKGAVSTLAGLGSLGEKTLNVMSEKAFPELGITGETKTGGQMVQESDLVRAKNTAQALGKTTEQIAEFFVPVGEAAKAVMIGKVTKAVKATPKAVKGIEMATKAAIEGTEQAARTASQEGEVNADVGIAGAFGAGSQVAGALVQKGLSRLGDAFFSLAIPSTPLERGRDIRKGLDLGKTLSETGISVSKKSLVKKIGDRISVLGTELDSAVDSATKAGVGTNFDDIASKAKSSIDKLNIGKEIQASPIDLEDAKAVIDDTITRYKEMYGGREMSAKELQKLKREIGNGLVKVFDRNMGAPIKAKAITETGLYGSLNSFLQKNVKGYEELNKKLAPLLESQERMLKKGGHSGLMTDVIAGSVVGSTGGSMLEDPVGFMKNALYGVLIKRGLTSTLAKTTAGTIMKKAGGAFSNPAFFQWYRQATKMSEGMEE